jgi:hypothetical protein
MGGKDPKIHDIRAVRLDECSVARVILDAGMVN